MDINHLGTNILSIHILIPIKALSSGKLSLKIQSIQAVCGLLRDSSHLLLLQLSQGHTAMETQFSNGPTANQSPQCYILKHGSR